MTALKSWGTPWQWWRDYWFQPTPLFNLAVCRLLIVGYQVIYLFNNDVLGRIKYITTLPDFLYGPLPILQLFFWPLGEGFRPSLPLLTAVFWLTVIAGIFGFLGLFSRPSLVIFALGNILLQAFLYSFRDFHHSEAVVMISLLTLALGRSGSALSIDDLRRRIKSNTKKDGFQPINLLGEKSFFGKWPLLVIQWVFAIVYIDSAVSKLYKSGFNWMNGYTLQFYLWQDGLIWERPVGIWLAHQHFLTLVASWVAIIFELTFPIVLIIPRLAAIYVPLGAAFHTGIYIAQKAPFLKYIPSYSVFVPWAKVVQKIPRRRLEAAEKLEVVYDAQATNCLRLVTIVSYFDWWQRLNYSQLSQKAESLQARNPEIPPSRYEEELTVILPHGATRKGFAAFRQLLPHLPFLTPLRLLLLLPSAPKVGEKIYDRLAYQKQQPS